MSNGGVAAAVACPVSCGTCGGGGWDGAVTDGQKGNAPPGTPCVDACQDIGGLYGASGWCNTDDTGTVWGSCWDGDSALAAAPPPAPPPGPPSLGPVQSDGCSGHTCFDSYFEQDETRPLSVVCGGGCTATAASCAPDQAFAGCGQLTVSPDDATGPLPTTLTIGEQGGHAW